MKIKQNSKAFTMVETLVSVCLFGFISVVLINVFVASINSQTRILQNQELMDQSTYALEYMAKSVRMAQKDVDGFCTGTINANYTVSTNSITFLAYDTKEAAYRCRQFFLGSAIIKEMRSTTASADDFAVAQDITSSKVAVTDLTFAVTGNVVGDTVQPKVTMMIEMVSGTSSSAPTITIQTSVSKRELDI